MLRLVVLMGIHPRFRGGVGIDTLLDYETPYNYNG